MDLLPHLLTPHDVSLWLSMPPARVVRFAKSGQIPCIVLPDGELMFDADELAAWLVRLRTEASCGE